MGLAEIEAELEKLKPDELRRLALKSWTAFVEREGRSEFTQDCSEDDPSLLAALDQAVTQANAAPNRVHSADDVRAQINQWTSR